MIFCFSGSKTVCLPLALLLGGCGASDAPTPAAEVATTDSQPLADAVLAQLPASLARDVRDDLEARRELVRLTPPRPVKEFRVGPARQLADLLAFYRGVQRRSGGS